MVVQVCVGTKLPPPAEAFNKLSRWQKFLVDKLGSAVLIGEFQPPGWTGPTKFFLFRCDKCAQLHVDCRHGHSEALYCSKNSSTVAPL